MVRGVMADIKLEMVENDFAEATKELHPNPNNKGANKLIGKNKRKVQQKTWGDGFLATLGCGNRVIFNGILNNLII